MSNINDLNPACSVTTGDFNTRSPQWWAVDKENNEGREISFLTSSAGYSQLIDQPTHITKESSFCIDLIFISNPSFISASGLELSLYEKCHHNLIYGKINFNVSFPPPYIREVWVFHNFIPNKKIKFNYKDPPWMTETVKSK